MQGQVVATANGDRLEFEVRWPEASKAGFRTQGLDLNQIKYLRCWVLGYGIADRLWNNEGFVDVGGNPQATLSIAGIPKGTNRIVVAQAYDGAQNPINGALLKGYYSSPPGQTVVKVLLKWRFLPAAEVLEWLLKLDPVLAARLDAQALQAAVDQVLYGANPAGGNVYAVHPSRIDAEAIAAQLKQSGGQLPDVAKMVVPVTATNLNVRAAAGQILAADVSLLIGDPASSLIQIPGNGTGKGLLANIAPGTWKAVAKANGLNGGVQAETTVTVGKDGSISLAEGTDANPLRLPPLSSAAVADATSLPAGLVGWWAGENNLLDWAWRHDGAFFNGAGHTPGRVGQGFAFDGVNDAMRAPVNWTSFPANGLTIAAWMKPNALNAWTGIEIDNTQCWYSAMLRINNTGRYQLSVPYWTGSCQWRAATAPAPAPLGVWTHVVGTYQNGCGNLYLNGQLAANFCDGLGTIAADDARVSLGEYDEAPLGAGKYYFNGALDEVQVYNRPLSAAEVLVLYKKANVTLTGDGFDPVLANNAGAVAGQAALVTAATGTTLALDPALNLNGSVSVQATVNGKTGNAATVVLPPIIDSFYPPAAREGQTVTIYGRGFAPGQTTVRFNGLAATVTASSATSLSATVPAGTTSGFITATTPSGIATSRLKFAIALANLVSLWAGEGDATEKINNRHGYLANGTVFAPGKLNESFRMDGANDHVSLDARVPNFTGLSTGTISLWYKSANNNINCQSLIYLGDKNSFNNLVEIGIGPWTSGFTDESLIFNVRQNGAAQIMLWVRRGEQFFADQQWHHIAVTMDTNGHQIYIDGVPQAVTYSNGNAALGNRWFNIPTAPNTMTLGVRHIGFPECYLNGSLDEVQIYDRPLSSAEVAFLFNAS